MVQVLCRRCSKEFYVKPSHQKLGFGKYCSRVCQHQAARKGKVVSCALCGVDTYKQPKDLQRSKSGKYFCSKSCQTRWRNQLYIGKAHKNYVDGASSYREALKRSGAKEACRRCNEQDARVLAVHHIDRNRNNNSVENLMYLCHNCHHLIHRHREEEQALMAAMV